MSRIYEDPPGWFTRKVFGAFFDGVGLDALDEEMFRVAPDYPTFRISISSS